MPATRAAMENGGLGSLEGFRLVTSMPFHAGCPSHATGGLPAVGTFRTEGGRLTHYGVETMAPPGGKTVAERLPQTTAIYENGKKHAGRRRAAEPSQKRRTRVC